MRNSKVVDVVQEKKHLTKHKSPKVSIQPNQTFSPRQIRHCFDPVGLPQPRLCKPNLIVDFCLSFPTQRELLVACSINASCVSDRKKRLKLSNSIEQVAKFEINVGCAIGEMQGMSGRECLHLVQANRTTTSPFFFFFNVFILSIHQVLVFFSPPPRPPEVREPQLVVEVKSYNFALVLVGGWME